MVIGAPMGDHSQVDETITAPPGIFQPAKTSLPAAQRNGSHESTSNSSGHQDQGWKIGVGVGISLELLVAAILALLLYYRYCKRFPVKGTSKNSNELEDTLPKKGVAGLWYRAEMTGESSARCISHELHGSPLLT